jgi:RND superfamily putative drug exporter
MKRLARWCIQHRWTVVLVWLVVLIGSIGVSNAVGSNFSDSFNLPHTPSTSAYNLIKSAAPKESGDVERVVYAVPTGQTITAPATASAITASLAKLESFPGVSGITSPLTMAGARQISRNGRIAYATVQFSEPSFKFSASEAKHFVAEARSPASKTLTVAVSGQIAEASIQVQFDGTLIGILLAGVVLFLVFGSIFAMLLPLLSAILSLGTAVGVIGLLSHVLQMPSFSDQLVLLIGLGVGVDYALFIVTRHRQGLRAGLSVTDSIVKAVDTSGRAVLFAGIIVCVALLGMFALGVSFLYGLAIASSIGVLFTMIAALTLLPAMLSFIGPKAMSRRQRKALTSTGPALVTDSSTSFWARWADFMRRRPLVPGLVALIMIAILIAPFLSMRLGSADQGNDSRASTTRVAYDLLATGFGPGFNGPLQLVAEVHGAQEKNAMAQLAAEVAKQAGVVAVTPPTTLANSSVEIIEVFPATSPQDSKTTALISHLRDTTIPAAMAGTGLTVYVGGFTAIFVDFANVLGAKLPLFVGLVVLVSFLLLGWVFRSLVVPITAAVMNLISIGAAYGILTAVFQYGVLGSLFGVTRTGPVESFVPVMMFAILFGLSMDYEIFLLTRIHEEWLRTGDNKLAVRNGLAATGKTITAAALIMLLVFGSFILGGQLVIKEFGLGLAAGVAIDAVIIRMAVVPSVMQLLGRSNWWFPKWLDRALPNLSVESSEDLAETRESVEV